MAASELPPPKPPPIGIFFLTIISTPTLKSLRINSAAFKHKSFSFLIDSKLYWVFILLSLRFLK